MVICRACFHAIKFAVMNIWTRADTPVIVDKGGSLWAPQNALSGITELTGWALFITLQTIQITGTISYTFTIEIVWRSICKHFETEGWMLIPQSVRVLQELKERNLTVGAVSNFDDTLESVLKRMSIHHYFDFVLPAWTAGCAKPDPEIYRQALDAGGATAAEAIHVGDDRSLQFISQSNANNAFKNKKPKSQTQFISFKKNLLPLQKTRK